MPRTTNEDAQGNPTVAFVFTTEELHRNPMEWEGLLDMIIEMLVIAEEPAHLWAQEDPEQMSSLGWAMTAGVIHSAKTLLLSYKATRAMAAEMAASQMQDAMNNQPMGHS